MHAEAEVSKPPQQSRVRAISPLAVPCVRRSALTAGATEKKEEIAVRHHTGQNMRNADIHLRHLPRDGKRENELHMHEFCRPTLSYVFPTFSGHHRSRSELDAASAAAFVSRCQSYASWCKQIRVGKQAHCKLPSIRNGGPFCHHVPVSPSVNNKITTIIIGSLPLFQDSRAGPQD